MHNLITVNVNGQKIKIAGQEATGKHIKQAATEQGVTNIDPSFDLFLETQAGLKQIGNDEHVKLEEGLSFISKAHTLHIHLNGTLVKLAQSKVTGLHIKEAAMEQGAPNVDLNDFLVFDKPDGSKVIEDDDKISVHDNDKFRTKQRDIEILVNEKPVLVKKSKLTGLEVKQAAIAQGVTIQLDFVLSIELGERRSKIVGDSDVVHVHKHSRFIAVAPDDNS